MTARGTSWRAAICLVVGGWTACFAGPHGRPPLHLRSILDPPYDTCIENLGTVEIDSAKVLFGDVALGGGVIAPGKGRGASALQYGTPIPDRATVIWQTSDGVLHHQEVEVRRLLPPRKPSQRYQIYFRIHEDTASVAVELSTPYGMPR